MLDDLVLALQGLVDRIARWARLGPTDENPRRRFLVVQIDGLSREVFETALKAGGIPNAARLMASGRFLRRPMSVGLPSSTPAFQAAAMYGIKPDIPGFHYYDKRARRELHFPEAGAADFVETGLAEGRRGILEGGSCYGCVFTGGADNSLLTFARLMKPTRAGLPLLRLGLSVVLLGWVIAKCLWLTTAELARFVVRVMAHPDSASHDGLRWLGLKIVFSIWVRELFTLSVSADLYRGIPAVYVNFLDYDVFAHSVGPTHRSAMRALRHIDNAIGQLTRIIERLPEHQYDLYILSDHGQTSTRTFPQVSGGQSLEQVTREILSAHDGRTDPPRRVHVGVARQIVSYRRADSRGILQRFFNHVERQRPVEISRDSAGEIIRIITAGPNAFVYFLDEAEPLALEEIERRHPRAAARLSEHAGIGLVLARSAKGPVCWWRGREVSLDDDQAGRGRGSEGPFAEREDRPLVLSGLRDLMAMRSAGDLVVYGIGAPGSDVSFIEERGAHAGPSEHEMRTFFIYPATVTVPEPLSHPIKLYGHFAAYREN
ncbi:MAG TPA: alkaline phosphatase family protein [Methylomirabilota bacterium]